MMAIPMLKEIMEIGVPESASELEMVIKLTKAMITIVTSADVFAYSQSAKAEYMMTGTEKSSGMYNLIDAIKKQADDMAAITEPTLTFLNEYLDILEKKLERL